MRCFFRNFLLALVLAGAFVLPAGAQTSECLKQLHASTMPTLVNLSLGAHLVSVASALF